MAKQHSKKAAAYCSPCQKFLYLTQQDAKKVARFHTTSHMNVYRCPEVPSMFHIGHLAQPVIDGIADRRDLYGTSAA